MKRVGDGGRGVGPFIFIPGGGQGGIHPAIRIETHFISVCVLV